MKDFWEKMKETKGFALLAALGLCALCLLLFPSIQGGGEMTAEEARISAALSRIAGAGETRVSIYYLSDESAFSGGKSVPCGAIVVSRGAADIAVRLQLMRAAQTLLGLPAEAVEVFAAGDGP